MRTRTAALTGVTLLVAATLSAFDGAEHRAISNAALRQAIGRTGLPPRAVAAARLLVDGAPGHTFGDLTESVDWFQDPAKDARDWTAVDHRRRQWIRRALATHNNGSHFQDGAAKRYGADHSNALRLAATGDYEGALRLEAFALHYLQDFFAPGHVVVPRAGMTDGIAGMLHDEYNRDGVKVIVEGQFFPDGKSHLLEFKGDGQLQGEQRRVLTEISRDSILQVLSSQSSAQPAMRLCFRPRSAEDDHNRPKRPVYGPYASLESTGGSSAPDCRCEAGALARYDFRTAYGLRASFYGATDGSLEMGVYGNRSQRVQDAHLVLATYDPIGRLRKRAPADAADCGDETFTQWFAGGGIAMRVNRIDGRHFHGKGFQVEATRPMRPFFASVYAGPEHYWLPASKANRVDFGAKVGLGLEVVNLGLMVERSHAVGADARFKPRYAFIPGVELAFSGTWLEHAVEKLFADAPRYAP